MGVRPFFYDIYIEIAGMDQDALKDLINKYLEGRASSAERARLFQYYEEQQEHSSWQEALMGVQQDVEKHLYNKILQEIEQRDQARKISFLKVWKIAASVALLLGLAGWALLFRQHPARQELVRMLTKAAPADKIDSIRLADGTRVFLNRGSRITYPEQFGKARREITLNGEAFLEVAPQKAPFMIHAGNTTTRVLGTSFNVKAYETDERIRVSVLTGKVSVTIGSDRRNGAVILSPGEEAVYSNQEHNIRKAAADVSLALSWREGKIKFRNTSFSEAIAELNSIYNTRITYQDKLRNCVLFADFDHNAPLEKVLDILSRSLNGRVLRKGDGTYFLTGTECK